MVKEAAYYKKEAGENEARVQKMKDDGVDQWTVKKPEEVLGESYMMIPDSEKRMKESIEDLFAFMVRARRRRARMRVERGGGGERERERERERELPARTAVAGTRARARSDDAGPRPPKRAPEPRSKSLGRTAR